MKKTIPAWVFSLLLGLSGCYNSTSSDGSYSTGIDYPVRDIQIIIPFGKGSASDLFVRKFAQLMSRELPVAVHPVNKEGAGGLLGMLHAARLPPDGYTILEITPSHIIADVLKRNENVALMKDFEPLVLVQMDHYVLLRRDDGTRLQLPELTGNGNRQITVGGISPNGLDEMTLRALSTSMGKPFRFVPYRSGYDVRAAVLSGEIDLYLGKLISTIKHIRSGKLKPLLVLNEKRLDHLPELASIPCSAELGYNVTIKSWRGFAIRKGTQKYIKDFLVDRIKYAYQSEVYQVFAGKHVVKPYDAFIGPDAFTQFWQQQFQFFAGLAAARTQAGKKLQ